MGLNDDEATLVATVCEFVDKQVRPTVGEVKHANEYPEAWIEQMKRIGIFGLAVPGGVRRHSGVDALLRAGHPGVGQRLNESCGRNGRPRGGGQAAGAVRHRPATTQRDRRAAGMRRTLTAAEWPVMAVFSRFSSHKWPLGTSAECRRQAIASAHDVTGSKEGLRSVRGSGGVVEASQCAPTRGVNAR
jgi:hypothetical protein